MKTKTTTTNTTISGLRVKTSIKSGGLYFTNHNATVVANG